MGGSWQIKMDPHKAELSVGTALSTKRANKRALGLFICFTSMKSSTVDLSWTLLWKRFIQLTYLGVSTSSLKAGCLSAMQGQNVSIQLQVVTVVKALGYWSEGCEIKIPVQPSYQYRAHNPHLLHLAQISKHDFCLTWQMWKLWLQYLIFIHVSEANYQNSQWHIVISLPKSKTKKKTNS